MSDELRKLLVCPDCNGTVSRRATCCPHCGCPMQVILSEQVEEKAATTETTKRATQPPAPARASAQNKQITSAKRYVQEPLYQMELPPPGISSPDFWEMHASAADLFRPPNIPEDEDEYVEGDLSFAKRFGEPDEEGPNDYYDEEDSGPDEEPYAYFYGDDEI